MSNIRYVRYKLGGQYPGISTELNWSIKDLFKCIKNILALAQFIFEHLKGSPLYAIVMTGCSFFVFYFHPHRQIRENSFNCHGKQFAKKRFRAPAWTSAKCYCGNKTGNLGHAVSLYLPPLGQPITARDLVHVARSRTLPYNNDDDDD